MPLTKTCGVGTNQYRSSTVKKGAQLFIIFLITAVMLAGCGIFSKTARLRNVEIVIDGDPAEWEDFPVVHTDPKGDAISIEFDISTVKAFANSDALHMYYLVESHIPPKQFSSLELELNYNGDLYRVAFSADSDEPGIMARSIGKEKWDDVTTLYGSEFAIGSAVEFSIPLEKFPQPQNLKIAGLRIMSGICCNQFEWYSVDAIRIGQVVEEEE